MALSKEAYLARGKRRVVHVQLIDGEGFVCSLSESERTAIELTIGIENKAGSYASNFRRRLLVKAICDEQGNRLFKDEEEDAIGGMDAADALALFSAAWKLAAFTREEVDQLEKK